MLYYNEKTIKNKKNNRKTSKNKSIKRRGRYV
jgi:hypothetical protein